MFQLNGTFVILRSTLSIVDNNLFLLEEQPDCSIIKIIYYTSHNTENHHEILEIASICNINKK